ncbi:peptidyl-glycine alpha-amidating monooxygenase B isoform X1 [Triplophysa dalaica]|uniref:peptidyl-glycine alpha-amidating monooxygenase B isoform X1 n=1 Tax=Triplophysa dalaica TaxID=1582913 RepID=UPI0024DFFF0A|nr:peptidyl-glycine alpha-amidating monooxygenase B isoform X1 [Triplophysa dalaica]XP_056592100.1 peptidyl-glycine alpha-amidating monooxygenase B isoform X1 [Triplophysa dalaica]XP_056592101.1 peptidyl-glycine alpha-amidating monooxygenase B isoform X1 [Triplophysa dalaica]XP_056592103.1 peptidyl-glycine alpha-amidating monooxygenase B isoform X1 [Triplophysa dalaica]XP_056592104.1 peptidyl-glycine alpha-amidating monooxygenase B isoform X1 [Triplophysa dalaica]
MAVLGCSLLVWALFCHSHGHNIENFRVKRFQDNAWSDPNDCSNVRQPLVLSNPYNFSLDIRLPGVTPTESDSYFCMAVPVPTSRDAYIVDFVPHASMDTAHHMLLYGCKKPYATKGYWDCGKELGTCQDQPNIMYAWARNAPPTKLPKDVGFKVGADSRITYFVLQIHYGDVSSFRDHHRDCSGLTLKMTSKPQPFIAGMYLMMSVDTVIPPGKKVINADIACTYSSFPMYPFAFRTHTHSLGKVVSGYRVRNGQWTQIGRQSPLLPQAFYPAANAIDVKAGDTLAARCVFTGEGRTTKTRIGGTSNDEMCNFYIMYYMDNTHAAPYMDCMDHGSSELFQNIPPEASIPIPVNPDHMMSMMHKSVPHEDVVKDLQLQQPMREDEVLDQGDFFSVLSKVLGERDDIVPVHKYNPVNAARAQARLLAEIDSIMQKKDMGWPWLGSKAREDAVLVRDRVHKFHQLESTVPPSKSGTGAARGEKQGAESHLVEEADWPEEELQLGQVAGLALNSDENLVIFHRGDHTWGINSFDSKGIYQQKSLGPIQQSTIVLLDPVKGRVLRASGRNTFYMPHGITTDKDDNYWVTDVALHQVFKLSSDGKDQQLVVLGEAFKPGSDKSHFCQPTDVAVDPETGNIFISDGYCNSRILKFSPEGRYITHWGAGFSDRRRRVPFWIPHSLTFLPDKRELCVADRDNGRIQCFMAETGEFVKEIKKDEFGGEVFAIAYSPLQGGLIYAVNGETPYGQAAPLRGFVISYSTKEILDSFSPDTQEFKLPHDIVVTSDGSCFVGDAGSDSVMKFVQSEKSEHRSVKKGGIEVQEIEETETFVQANIKPLRKSPVQSSEVNVQKIQEVPPKQHHQSLESPKEEEKPQTLTKQGAQGMSPAVITTLLLVPLAAVIAVAVFIRWRKSHMYRDDCDVKLEPSGSTGGILGKLRGKAAGTLNLGNFFATHKGYTRHGFDRLSTEGSDLEKDDEDATDSENEEYSAPPPPVSLP